MCVIWSANKFNVLRVFWDGGGSTVKLDDCVEESDPGLIILYASAATVHAAMALPGVATVRPQLRRGATPQQSLQNLMLWVDDVVQRHGGPGCRVERSRNLIVRGFYQRLLQAQQSRIIGELSASTRQWTGSLMANNASCGILFSVEGSGKGLCNIVQMDTGPFQDVQLQEVMATGDRRQAAWRSNGQDCRNR